MKYAFIRSHREVWPIGIQCGVLKVREVSTIRE